MQQRNRLLADGVRDNARFEGLERIMAETGIAIAAARAEVVAALAGIAASGDVRDPQSPFPAAGLRSRARSKRISERMRRGRGRGRSTPRVLRDARERDRAAGRTLDGPAPLRPPRLAPAPKPCRRACAPRASRRRLLIGLVLAHAELVARRREGIAPILLLDEMTAHLDEARRAALFAEDRSVSGPRRG